MVGDGAAHVRSQIYTFDPATSRWAAVGAEFDGRVFDVATGANGELIVGGEFTQVGGTNMAYVARWDGAQWQPLGSGAFHDVEAVLVMPNGDVIASGDFRNVAQWTTVARWDGMAWQAIGSTHLGLQAPRDLVLWNGQLIASGGFSALNGTSAMGIARWNGSAWHALSGLTCQSVPTWPTVVTASPSGDLYAIATHSPFGAYPVSCISQWDGATWNEIHGPIGVGGNWNVLHDLEVLANDEIVAAGNVTLGGMERFCVHWNGSTWDEMNGGTNSMPAAMLTLPNGSVLMGGNFTTAGPAEANGMALWDNGQWSRISTGINGDSYSVAALPDGGFVVGGDFTSVDGRAALHVAQWKDGAWSNLGGGVGGLGHTERVHSVAALPNGDIVAGGYFPEINGATVNNIARWDGSSWHAMGSGITGGQGYTWVNDMVVMPDGDLVVSGRFYQPYGWLARWDGTQWSSVGGQGWDGTQAIAASPNGDLYIAYSVIGGSVVMHWNGSSWNQLGANTSWHIETLAVSANGVLAAGGSQSRVATWDGTQWVQLIGSNPIAGTVLALEWLTNGDLIATGQLSNPENIARWNGSTWLPVADGVNAQGRSLATLTDGTVAVAGHFTKAGSTLAPFVSVLTSTCPAAVASYGAGCNSSAGPIELTASGLPMLGGTMHGTTTGLPNNALAVGVFAFNQVNVALSAVHPQGVPGCDVLVDDAILLELLVGNGSVQSSIDVPIDLQLIGADFYHQVVPVEIDSNGQILAITSSNGLALTVGSF